MAHEDIDRRRMDSSHPAITLSRDGREVKGGKRCVPSAAREFARVLEVVRDHRLREANSRVLDA